MLRMTAKIGLLAEISGVRRTRSRRKALLSRSYSPEKLGLRDLAAQGLDVVLADADAAALAQALARAARCARARRSRCSRPGRAGSSRCASAAPSPKATSSATETVPQVMPNRVRSGAQLLVADVLQHLREEGEGGHGLAFYPGSKVKGLVDCNGEVVGVRRVPGARDSSVNADIARVPWPGRAIRPERAERHPERAFKLLLQASSPTRSSWAAARPPGPSPCRPSAISTFRPSERPVLISFFTGSACRRRRAPRPWPCRP